MIKWATAHTWLTQSAYLLCSSSRLPRFFSSGEKLTKIKIPFPFQANQTRDRVSAWSAFSLRFSSFIQDYKRNRFLSFRIYSLYCKCVCWHSYLLRVYKERLLGFTLGSALTGFIVLEQRKLIHESVADRKSQSVDQSQVIYRNQFWVENLFRHKSQFVDWWESRFRLSKPILELEKAECWLQLIHEVAIGS